MTEVELDLKDLKRILGWHTLAFAKGISEEKPDEKTYRKILTLKEAEEDFLESIKDE
jgi:hypothetical protein